MFRIISDLWRLLRTVATLQRNGAVAAICDYVGFGGLRKRLLLLFTLTFWPFGRKGDPALPPVARALSAMGPAYVKFGQILSTRPDVVGERFAQDLRILQDRLPPFTQEQAQSTIERDLGRPLDEIFSELGPPVAAASIAQVHPAVRRSDGRKVAVKILRPDVERRFKRDISAFFLIARTLQGLFPALKRLRPLDVVRHFEGVVNMELDLRLEAAGANEFRQNSKDDEGFKVPEVFWEGSGRRVMTLEWVDGTPMGDRAAIMAQGHDMPRLAERILQIFLKHALRDGYFHADMHQGNLRLDDDGTIVALDFGIMGRIDGITRRHYAEILYGFLTRNYRRVAQVHFEAGYIPADRDVDAFAQSLRAIAEPILGQDVSRISMGKLLFYLLETTERFGMETRTELILLQRTMVVVEGVARSIDPQTNIWNAARPVVEDWIKANLGPRAALRDMRETGEILLRFAPRLPGIAEELLMRAEELRTARRKAAIRATRPRGWLWALGGAAAGSAVTALIAWAL